jgi:hypothetical protein
MMVFEGSELSGFASLQTSTAPGAPSWKQRFGHYFKLHTDLDETDFETEAGLVRDLFVADSIKSRALGLYQTIPGAVVKWREGAAKGTGVTVIAGFAGALIGAVVSPLVTYMLPDKATPNAASASATDASITSRASRERDVVKPSSAPSAAAR